MHLDVRPEAAATRRLAGGAAAVLAVAVPAYLLLPRPAAEVLYQVVAWTSIVALLIGIRRNKAPLAPFLALLAGWACFAAGDLLFAVYDVVLHETPFPSPADGLYLAGYPLLAAGLLALVRRRQPRGDHVALLDAGIITVSCTVLAWVYLIGPQTHDGSLSILEKVFSVAYPAGDLLCLAVLVRLVVAGPRGSRSVSPSLAAMGAALAALLMIDLAFSIGAVTETYVSGGLIDSLYLVPYVLMAVAGLHPSVRRSGAPVPSTDVSLTRARLVLLASVAVLTPAMMALEAGLGHSLAVPVIVGGTTVVFLLVVARMATLVDALEVSRAQLSHDAGHDSLTGLANRALLVHAIVATMASRRRLALVFIDLDHFKSVNDTFGHMAGDRLLIEAGNRLRASTERGFVARMGGDEFVVLLTDAEASAAEAVAARIAERLNERGVVDTVGPTLAASVGVAHWEPVDSAREDPFRTVETLLDRTDVAMYETKRSERGRLVAIETDELVERRRTQPATTR